MSLLDALRSKPSALDLLAGAGWVTSENGKPLDGWKGPGGTSISFSTINKMKLDTVVKVIENDLAGLKRQQEKANEQWAKAQDPTSHNQRFNNYEKLAMRVGVERGATFGFDCVHIFQGPSIVFVMIVHGDKATILEDDKGLFPSDSLLAKWHLTKNSFTS